MAVIRALRHEVKGHGSRHGTDVDCLYFDFLDTGGQRILQLSTLGSDHRQSQPKVSQTIQIGPDAARDLAGILDATFSLGLGDGSRSAVGRMDGGFADGARGGGSTIEVLLAAAALEMIEVLASDGVGRPTRVLARDPRPFVGGLWHIVDLSDRPVLRFADVDALQRETRGDVRRLVVIATQWSDDLERALRRNGVDLVAVAELSGGDPQPAGPVAPTVSAALDLVHESVEATAHLAPTATHTRSFRWIEQALASPTYQAQRLLGGRAGVDDELVRGVLGALVTLGGRGRVADVERHASLPRGSLLRAIAPLRRLLNVDGYETLALEDGTVVLDTELLRHQFGVAEDTVREGEVL